jgi:hypothetical protein
MPWYRESKKDVTSCEKPREGANNLRSVDIRMGQPDSGNAESFSRVRGRRKTEGSETSKYLQEKKPKRFP